MRVECYHFRKEDSMLTSLHDIAERLGVHYLTIFRACKTFEIETQKINGLVMVPTEQADGFFTLKGRVLHESIVKK